MKPITLEINEGNQIILIFEGEYYCLSIQNEPDRRMIMTKVGDLK
jgi:hypothetical protein